MILRQIETKMLRCWKLAIFLMTVNLANVHVSKGETISDVENVIRDFFSAGVYNKQIRGQNDLSKTMNVTLSFALQYIQKLDDLQETLQLQGVLFIEWKDERLIWNALEYNNTKMVYVAADTIWRPEIVVANPSVILRLLGDDISRLVSQHFNDGFAVWSVADIFHCTCSVDLTAFPWDVQNCTLDITVWGYMRHEIQLVPKQMTIDLSQFKSNGQWILSRTRVYTKYHHVKSVLAFEIVLKRRPVFFIVNILLPIVTFSLLNLSVFIVPIETGERISFSLTLLLSIGVFITMISSSLPPNAETMASVCYFLLFIMVQSTIICLFNIISIKIYFKANEDSLPTNTWSRCFMYFNKLKCCFRSKLVVFRDDKSNNINEQTDAAGNNGFDFAAKKQGSLSWKDISKMIDQIFLLVTTVSSALSYIIFVIHVS